MSEVDHKDVKLSAATVASLMDRQEIEKMALDYVKKVRSFLGKNFMTWFVLSNRDQNRTLCYLLQ